MPRNEKILVQIALLTQFFTALPKTWNPDSGYLIRHYNFWSLFSLLSTKYSFEKRNLKINSILNLSINYFYFRFFLLVLKICFGALFFHYSFHCNFYALLDLTFWILQIRINVLQHSLIRGVLVLTKLNHSSQLQSLCSTKSSNNLL